MKSILNKSLFSMLLLLLSSTALASQCNIYLANLIKQIDQHDNMSTFYSQTTNASSKNKLPTLNELENHLGRATVTKKMILQFLYWDKYAALIYGNDVVETVGKAPASLNWDFGTPSVKKINTVMGKPKKAINKTLLLYRWSCSKNAGTFLTASVLKNKIVRMTVMVCSPTNKGISCSSTQTGQLGKL